MKNIVIFYLMFSTLITIYGQPGTIDISFNNTGIIIKDLDGNDESGKDIAIGEDGVIFITGNSGKAAYIISYNSDGSLNNSYGDNGLVTKSSNDFDYVPNSIRFLPDSTIIISGYTWTNITGVINIFLMKFNRDGKNDTTFGAFGKVIVSLSDTIRTRGNALAIKNDGKIIVAGDMSTKKSGDFRIVILSYHANGMPDTLFGINGKVITDFGGIEEANSIFIQYDNKILVSGNYKNSDSNSEGLILLRYFPDGKIDSSFAEKGYTIIDKADLYCNSSICVQSDKKILVAGESNNNFMVARFDTTGILDSSFGVDGIVTTDFGRMDMINDIIIQKDSKIVVIGSTYDGWNCNLALARYKTDGSLDSSFGNFGKVIFKYNYLNSGGESIALQNDEKIVVSGFIDNNTYNSYDILLARFLSENITEIRDLEVIDLNMWYYYPNPVKDRINIKYSIKCKTKVSFQILDINGRLIETLINKEYRNSGDYTEEFMLPKILNNGLYLIRLLSDSDIEYKILKIIVE